jgi:hypothetical protein
MGGLSTQVALMVRVELCVSAKSGRASSTIGTQIIAHDHRTCLAFSTVFASYLWISQVTRISFSEEDKFYVIRQIG